MGIPTGPCGECESCKMRRIWTCDVLLDIDREMRIDQIYSDLDRWTVRGLVGRIADLELQLKRQIGTAPSERKDLDEHARDLLNKPPE